MLLKFFLLSQHLYIYIYIYIYLFIYLFPVVIYQSQICSNKKGSIKLKLFQFLVEMHFQSIENSN